MITLPENKLSLQLPLKIRFEAIEKLIQQKLIGFQIKNEKEEKQFGEVLNVQLLKAHSSYDVCIEQEIRLHTLLFNKKTIKFQIHLKFEYNASSEELQIKKYKVEGEQKTWLVNKLLETVMQLLLKNKLSTNSQFNLKPKLDELLLKINDKLESIIEVKQGVLVYGGLENLKIMNLYFKEENLILQVSITGKLAAEISEIELPKL